MLLAVKSLLAHLVANGLNVLHAEIVHHVDLVRRKGLLPVAHQQVKADQPAVVIAVATTVGEAKAALQPVQAKAVAAMADAVKGVALREAVAMVDAVMAVAATTAMTNHARSNEKARCQRSSNRSPRRWKQAKKRCVPSPTWRNSSKRRRIPRETSNRLSALWSLN